MRLKAFIDPHTHLRGAEYMTDYASLALRDAYASGVRGVFEMPNPKPNLVWFREVLYRYGFIQPRNLDIYYRVNMGITNDIAQVQHAVSVAMKERQVVSALKMFLCDSSGNMGVKDPDYQKRVWREFQAQHYKGVIMLHCEDENEWQGQFVATNPITHSLRQNPESEYLQVERQIKFAFDAKFEGMIYVCHISNPATVDLIQPYRNSFHAGGHLHGLQIVGEVTWHHMFLNYLDYLDHGNRVKMNPPLRSQRMQESLLERVFDGKIDVIGSDHAPHPVEEKNGIKPPSGIPALPFWPKGAEKLIKLGMLKHVLEQLTGSNACYIFGIEIPRPLLEMKYDPSLWDAYGWNPFSRVDKE